MTPALTITAGEPEVAHGAVIADSLEVQNAAETQGAVFRELRNVLAGMRRDRWEPPPKRRSTQPEPKPSPTGSPCFSAAGCSAGCWGEAPGRSWHWSKHLISAAVSGGVQPFATTAQTRCPAVA